MTSCGTAASSGDTVTVFAAASLQKPFTELGQRFEASHPGVDVRLSFAGSSDLVAQLSHGAPADVFASADTDTMRVAVEDGLVSGDPVTFAANTLTIVTEPGNPEGIASLTARPGEDRTVVVCVPQVPCGAATARAETAAGVDLAPVSEEMSVTDVLGKVTSGQADAGLVYVTDAQAAGDRVTAVPFPEAAGAVNTYPIAVLRQARDPSLATQFRVYVTGPEGRSVLAGAGFAAP
ncbi:molybdate ABC transporter substrate-binding protein [Rhodococcus sp. CC-R104]|uniref:Molybdate ABC transporter substrate-binding protein n=1 Tax=Rhodococcus chondri TaxID=3065941 RepID=A0ABU7JZ71_9NOCA|nr:molybdate ABC transporter substrate-binding protein [Rhodococcus sp. CC-R104]MEE2034602.1 molybdate ABC transporter substrate-binding protein [Rhodococcus sp. CC-R104]